MGIVAAIEANDADQLSAVVRENARVMTLDKINLKLLSEVKKVHCPDLDQVITN